MNTYAKIATLIELHSTLVEHSNPIPTPDLAVRAAQLVIDEQFSGCVYRMAAGDYLRAAVLWGRISDRVTTKARFDTLLLAAVFAHNSRNLYLAANYVAQLQRLSHTEGFEIPTIVAVLKRNHAFRDILINATPSCAIDAGRCSVRSSNESCCGLAAACPPRRRRYHHNVGCGAPSSAAAARS